MIFITIIAFLFIIAFSVTIHELGHFLLAKIFRIPVEKFSIGFGPPLIKRKIGETDFRIAYFPVGGYVKMAGEDEGEMPLLKRREITDETSINEEYNLGFYDVPIWHRVLVVLSGPVSNLISAIVVLFFVYTLFGVYVNPYLSVKVDKDSYGEGIGLSSGDSLIALNGEKLDSWDEFTALLKGNIGKNVKLTLKRNGEILEKDCLIPSDSLGINPKVPALIGSVKIGGPADRAGMKPKDRILKINGEDVYDWEDFVTRVRSSKNIPLTFTWQQESEIREAIITPLPSYDPILKDTVGQIGVMIHMARHHIFIHKAVVMAVNRTGEIIVLTLKTLYQLLIGKISRKALGGPIAIAQLSGESARWGFENLLGLLSIISINLGLVNLFPIPGLDGGHIIIALIEGIRKKRFTRKTRLLIQQVGYTILLLLIVYVTFNDLTR